MLHELYLPFSKCELAKHFLGTLADDASEEKYTNYYTKLINRYPNGKCLEIEKDEKFWTAAALMTLYHNGDCSHNFASLMSRVFGNGVRFGFKEDWLDAIGGQPLLFFEVAMPSPSSYNDWLRLHMEERNPLPYIRQTAKGKKRVEGPTHLDAMLIDRETGFSMVFESKVTSDMSVGVNYDTKRNQMARIIDVLLDRNPRADPRIRDRDPNRTFFLLLTPAIFKPERQHDSLTRFYCYKYQDYKARPEMLAKDLPHREVMDWHSVTDRLGWTTFEELREIAPKCCPWLDDLR